MGKGKSKGGYYAVAKGRSPGIYTTWEDCEAQVKGIAGARFKKFASLAEAEAFAAPGTGSTSNRKASSSTSFSDTSPRFQPYPRPSSLPVKGPIKMTSNAEIAAEEEGCDIVFSDGACKGNGQIGSIAGVGVWWGYRDPRNIAERCPGKQTNNRAELIAIVRVLETTPITSKPLIIKTDSKYSIQCLTEWFPKWVWNDFRKPDGKPVTNKELLQYLASLLELRVVKKQKVRFVYVKGHAGIEGNEGADYQANLGTTMEERLERDWDEEREKVQEIIKQERDKGLVPAKAEVEVVTENGSIELHMDDQNPMPSQSPPEQKTMVDKATQKPARSQRVLTPTVAKKAISQPIIPTRTPSRSKPEDEDEDEYAKDYSYWDDILDPIAADAELRKKGY